MNSSKRSISIPRSFSKLLSCGSFSLVAVSDESLTAFNDLKLGKKHKYVIYKINDSKTEIIVDKISSDESYDAFLEALPEDDSRYAVYDFQYEISSTEGKRSKIIFFTWSPETASVRSKMIYASSKDALRRALNGVSTDIQGTDFSDVAFESVLERVSRGAGSH
ncbi:Cofilin, promotes actin filament depolarization in a pH-dependent manner [Komagataella phaffii GS115]|uniref:Cofilin n=1 Tax=Komagataella phaffii (strain GS115 / ATCC 20864) TaxID=644223 RepID=C4QX88_KOMPG|nr:Cofilin, promotes actin filament depolarization in a pH-dependent manner [Komagataella phaffii GS115]CAY67861.1 Cofilin, promotes actin filament depolarization in a pH-dependent manner [Komagataella phaffii GS115]